MKKTRTVLSLTLAMAMLGGTALNASAVELRDLFDAEYYAERHADVKAALGTDPDVLFDHYVNYGVKEGRKGSRWFDVKRYRNRYEDLENAFGDNWEAYVNHYLTYGYAEQRDGGGEAFDAASYANRYEDVKEAYGYDWKQLFTHYQVFGIKEERVALSQTIVDKWEEDAIFLEKLAAAENAVTNPSRFPCTEIQQWPNGETEEVVYDANGNAIKQTHYDTNGQLMYSSVSEYDEYGNMTLHMIYSRDGKLEVKHMITYDNTGKRQVEKVYYYGADGEIDYYNIMTHISDTRIVEKSYDGDDSYSGKTEYYYPTDGSGSEFTRYDENDVKFAYEKHNEDGSYTRFDYYASGAVMNKSIYNSMGLCIEEITYDESGNETGHNYYDEEGNLLTQ